MRRQRDEDAVGRQLLVSLGVLVGVSALIAGVVSVAALGAVRLSGVGNSAAGGPAAAPSLYLPAPSPRPRRAERPARSAAPEPPATAATRTPKPDRRPPRPPAIRLSTSTPRVPAGGRIYLAGRYPAGSGTALQVQRFSGSWVDFPVTVVVREGSFSTYLISGRIGRNRFRVLDERTGRTSNPVTVTIG